MAMIIKSLLIVLGSTSLLQTVVQGACDPSCYINSTKTPPGYYWRDYFGSIPEDAVEGGFDKTGNSTYVGQVYTKDFELLPATITPGSLKAIASAYIKTFEVDKNIKILCTNVPHKVVWVATKNDETHLLTKCHFVVGGSEVGQTLNIGRVNYDGQTVIGKVFRYPLDNRGLWIPYNTMEMRFLTYEILTYNCDPIYI